MIDFYREDDLLYVYFAGGDYTASSPESDGFGTQVIYKRCVDGCEDWAEPVQEAPVSFADGLAKTLASNHGLFGFAVNW